MAKQTHAYLYISVVHLQRLFSRNRRVANNVVAELVVEENYPQSSTFVAVGGLTLGLGTHMPTLCILLLPYGCTCCCDIIYTWYSVQQGVWAMA